MQLLQKKVNFLKHFIRGSKADKPLRSVRFKHVIAELESGNETAFLSLLKEFHLTSYSTMLLNLLNSNNFKFELPTRIDDKTRIYSVSVQNILAAFRSGVPCSIRFFVEKLDRNNIKASDSLGVRSAQRVDTIDYDSVTIGYLSSSQQDLKASPSLSEQLYCVFR